MAKWEQRKLKLNKNHSWTGKKGNMVFVADRGAVHFELPDTWIIKHNEKGENPMEFYNADPPNDDCRLQMSLFHLNPEIDWKQMDFAEAYEGVLSGRGPEGKFEEDDAISRQPVVILNRPGQDILWAESLHMDTKENRQYRSRTCMAHRGLIQVILTLDFWPEDAERFVPVWDDILSSLRLGEYMADPRQGPPRQGPSRTPPRRRKK